MNMYLTLVLIYHYHFPKFFIILLTSQGLTKKNFYIITQKRCHFKLIQQVNAHNCDLTLPVALKATPGDNMEKLEERLSLEGKMVVDLTDPNRPRFTLSELRDVLQERNELKTKLLEVEEELHQYKPEAAAGKEEGGEG